MSFQLVTVSKNLSTTVDENFLSMYLSSISIYIYLWRRREIYFKIPALVIVEAGKFKICRLATQRTGTVSGVQAQSAGRIPSSSGKVSLFSLQPVNWLDEDHPHYEG